MSKNDMPEAATDNRRPDSEEQEIEREEQNALQALRELTADEDTPAGESRSKLPWPRYWAATYWADAGSDANFGIL